MGETSVNHPPRLSTGQLQRCRGHPIRGRARHAGIHCSLSNPLPCICLTLQLLLAVSYSGSLWPIPPMYAPACCMRAPAVLMTFDPIRLCPVIVDLEMVQDDRYQPW